MVLAYALWLHYLVRDDNQPRAGGCQMTDDISRHWDWRQWIFEASSEEALITEVYNTKTQPHIGSDPRPTTPSLYVLTRSGWNTKNNV